MKKIFFLLFVYGIQTIQAQVPSSEKTALIAFYNSTAGINWVNNTNWDTSDPVATWNGITVENIAGQDHVTKIILIDNNLIGTLPVELVNLTALTTLIISNNQLSGSIPNLTALPLIYFRINNNDFQFGDFEAEFSVYNTYSSSGGYFNYIPMNKVALEIDELIVVGNTYTYTMPNISGTGVTYQWYKNNELLVGETSLSYELTNAQISDAVKYSCKASSTIVTDLFIERSAIYLRAEVLPADKAALVALYNATDGGNWTNHSNWNTTAPVYDWYGVEMQGDRVTSISLENNNLLGTIPTNFGDLTALKSLNLVYNHISGSIPVEVGDLVALESLELSFNQLSGSIPPELGNLINVKYLDLMYNQLTGTIPTNIRLLTNVEVLFLSSNQLTGSIPPVMGELTALKNLLLDKNQLTGSIPPEIGNWVNIENLGLNDNQLTGTIPIAIGTMINLRYLSLHKNQLTGFIPQEIGNLVNLLGLYLYSNQLSGSIPSEIGNLIHLESLNLNDNQLTGDLPTEMGNLLSLTRLVLKDNQLTGTIPTSLSNLVAMRYLYLNNNQFSGTVSIFDNMSVLRDFYIENNQIVGDIDLSNNNILRRCRVNNTLISSLNVRNGNNIEMSNSIFNTTNCPNLTCIIVDDAAYSAANWSNIDTMVTFVESQAACDALYVDETSFNDAVAVYPNPVSTVLNINYIGSDLLIKIEIFNVLGQKIKDCDLVNTIDISDFKNGIYILKLKNKQGKSANFRIVKQ